MNSNLKLKINTIFKESFNELLLFHMHIVGVPVPSISDSKYKYILYIIELHTHYIIDYKLFNTKPNTKDVLEMLNNLYKKHSIYNVVFMKGSPYTKQSLIHYLDERKILYSHLSRNEYPEILSISSAYLTRMVKFNIVINHKIHDRFIKDLMSFWNARVVPITNFLPEHNLIDGSVHVKIDNSNIYTDSDKRIHSLENHSKINVYLLSYHKIYHPKQSILSILVLCDLKSNRLDKLDFIKGSIREKDLIYFLKTFLNNYSTDLNLLIPNKKE